MPVSATPLSVRTDNIRPSYQAYTWRDMVRLPQLRRLTAQQLFELQVVSQVLPFKSNRYVVDHLINWDDPRDPIFQLTFPQPGMLKPDHFSIMADAVRTDDPARIRETANEIRRQLNPHPAGQKSLNVPQLADGTPLEGMQHKYSQTVLFFASQGQTCHAYCTFCFRWPQFVALDGLKFAMKEAQHLVQYLREHPEVTDVLFTGGDPMVMKSRIFATYLNAVLDADLPNIQTIRIGTKAVSYWPHRFLTDPDAQDMLNLLKTVVDRGKQLAVMMHVNHPNELQTKAAEQAIAKLRETGAILRSQSPLMAHINDDPGTWSRMWNRQLQLGIIPYYMFVARNTGAQHYFSVPLARAWRIYAEAARNVSGLGRTVRGPSMSCLPGKVEVNGMARIAGEKVFVLRMLQGRNPDWAYRPFFARYNEDACWLDDLIPAFGDERFFFETDPEWGSLLDLGVSDDTAGELQDEPN